MVDVSRRLLTSIQLWLSYLHALTVTFSRVTILQDDKCRSLDSIAPCHKSHVAVEEWVIIESIQIETIVPISSISKSMIEPRKECSKVTFWAICLFILCFRHPHLMFFLVLSLSHIVKVKNASICEHQREMKSIYTIVVRKAVWTKYMRLFKRTCRVLRNILDALF